MPRPSLLSDEFLRHLMAVGQVDVLVGLPTFNNAATVEPIAKAVHVAFAQHFPRLRTVLLNSDGGSTDGTPEIVRAVTLEATDGSAASQALRTIHRIVTPHAGALGKGNALRMIFAAADLSQTKALAVLDPDVTSVTPEWIAKLVKPVLEGGRDYVTPVYERQRFEGALVTQIVRPLFQGIYRAPLREPVGGEFGCSRRFATHCLTQDVWDREFTRYGVDIWLGAEAAVRGFTLGQTVLGRHVQARTGARVELRELFDHVVGALFTCMELHEDRWTGDLPPSDVATVGDLVHPALDAPADVAGAIDGFRSAMADLDPLLRDILDPATYSGLQAALRANGVTLSDDLWARVLGDVAIAWARQRVSRDHLMQTLVRLYLGRVAVFVQTHRNADAETVERSHAALCAACENLRPAWIERWNA